VLNCATHKSATYDGSSAAVFPFVAFTPSCCAFTTSFHTRRAYNRLGVIGMFDVYVRGKNQLLVIRRGSPLPSGLVGGWRKKRTARTVSDEISGAVMREGFYRRSQMALIDTPDARASYRRPVPT
jgi:hypothetical protein